MGAHLTPFPHTDIAEQGPRVLAALCTSPRDADRYWCQRPSDHSAKGFFIGGPQEPVQPLTRLAELVESRCSEQPEGPRGARQRMAREKADKARILENQQRFLAALRGERVPRSRRGFVHRAA